MTLQIDIRKHFDTFTLDMGFEVGNEVFGLLGASGCGKSLTMRSVAGIETPDEGRIVVNDETFFDSEKGINLSPQKRKTALLFQNYMLFPNLTVAENVGAGIPKDTPKEERERIIKEELARFDLSGPFANRYPAQLSGGQQQRVALARMLAAKPGILMMDEPFSALDSHLKGVLEQNLTGLFEVYHGTVLYVSHDIDEALRFCDRIAVVENGHIMEIDKGRELMDDPKSLAGLKLSGCKNATEAVYVDDHRVYCPYWGIELVTEAKVPRDVKAIGVRAFYGGRAEKPGVNVFRVKVDRISDSRYDRTALVEFLDRSPEADRMVEQTEQEMHYLHQRFFWRVDFVPGTHFQLPEKGEELLLSIPPDSLYVVTK